MAVKRANVPCDGCIECCKGNALWVCVGHNLSECKPPKKEILDVLLAASPYEDCPFLGDHGCTIHEDKPDVCKVMDCRVTVQILPESAIDNGYMSRAVWDRGRYLLEKEHGERAIRDA